MSSSTFKYPALTNEGGLSLYLEQIKKFPMLDAEEVHVKRIGKIRVMLNLQKN